MSSNHILYSALLNINLHKFFDHGLGDAQGIDDSDHSCQLSDTSFPESYVGYNGDGQGDGIRKNCASKNLNTDYRVSCEFHDGYGDGDFTTYYSSMGYVFAYICFQSSSWAKYDDEVIYSV